MVIRLGWFFLFGVMCAFTVATVDDWMVHKMAEETQWRLDWRTVVEHERQMEERRVIIEEKLVGDCRT
jgi:hypothetical protein